MNGMDAARGVALGMVVWAGAMGCTGPGDEGTGDGGPDAGQDAGSADDDNVSACQAAQQASDTQLAQCGADLVDFNCDAYGALDLDCTPVFDEVAETVSCDNGAVSVDREAECVGDTTAADNLAACAAAEAAMRPAFEACGEPFPDGFLACWNYDDPSRDCVAFFQSYETSVTCQDGTLWWENDAFCVDTGLPQVSCLVFPDNVRACTDAQDALNAARVACGLPGDADLRCQKYATRCEDCDAYFQGLIDTVTCGTDATVSYTYGPACQ